jgi:hypothetical protein
MIYGKDVWYSASVAALGAIIAVASLLLVTGAGSPDAGAELVTETPPTAEAAVTPGMTQEPEVDDVTRDFARAIDLGSIRDTLHPYRDRFGSFPETGGELTTLCESEADAGCALTAINPRVPFDDGELPYWYVSDGRVFTLVARAALPQANNGACPGDLPPSLEGVPIMCMNGGE